MGTIKVGDKIKVGKHILDILMEQEDGKDKILEYARKIQEQDKNYKSLAMEILSDYKKQNTILKILLGLSIIANIVIVLILK